MARQWTKEETARGWLVAAQGEEVDAPPMPPRLPVAKGIGLHPEADARLAAATTGARSLRIDENNRDAEIARGIPASPSDGKAYRIEAAVNNGPTFALVGTIAEIDARLRSGFVGVDVATGETGKASEWPMVAEKMRAEVAGMMGPAGGRWVGSSWATPEERAEIDRMLNAPPLAVGQVWQFDGDDSFVLVRRGADPEKWETRWREGDGWRNGEILAYKIHASHGCRYIGTSSTVIDDAAPVFRDVKIGDQLPTLAPIALLEWLCPNIGRARAERIAPLCVGVPIGRELIAAVRRHWVGPAAAREEPLTLHPSTRLDAITIGGLAIRCPVVESGSPEGFTVRAQVTRETCCALQAACCNGKPVDIEANGRTRRAVVVKYNEQRAYFTRADFDVTIEMRWWVEAVPSLTWNGVPAPDALVDTSRAAAPAKPAALAAGQVWARAMATSTQRRTLTRPDPAYPNAWFSEERPDHSTPGWTLLTMDEWRYLGTREEVAAAERAARVTASSERMVAKARERADNEVREEAARLGVPFDFDSAGNPTLTNRDESIKAIHDATIARMRMRETDAQRARKDLNHLRHALCAALATNNVTTDLDFATATVTVTAPGCEAAAIARAIEQTRRWAPGGCEVVAAMPENEAQRLRVAQKMSEVYNAAQSAFDNPDRWTPEGLANMAAFEREWAASPLAVLRATIDALIAADHGPFAHARAAALRSLGEPDGGHLPPLKMPAVVMAMLRAYEDERGGSKVPSRAVTSGPRGSTTTERAVATYERERARSDAYARPSHRSR